MKASIIEGIAELKSHIADTTFYYFTTTDFEPTEAVVPVMREVVKIALEKGLRV